MIALYRYTIVYSACTYASVWVWWRGGVVLNGGGSAASIHIFSITPYPLLYLDLCPLPLLWWFNGIVLIP